MSGGTSDSEHMVHLPAASTYISGYRGNYNLRELCAARRTLINAVTNPRPSSTLHTFHDKIGLNRDGSRFVVLQHPHQNVNDVTFESNWNHSFLPNSKCKRQINADQNEQTKKSLRVERDNDVIHQRVERDDDVIQTTVASSADWDNYKISDKSLCGNTTQSNNKRGILKNADAKSVIDLSAIEDGESKDSEGSHSTIDLTKDEKGRFEGVLVDYSDLCGSGSSPDDDVEYAKATELMRVYTNNPLKNVTQCLMCDICSFFCMKKKDMLKHLQESSHYSSSYYSADSKKVRSFTPSVDVLDKTNLALTEPMDVKAKSCQFLDSNIAISCHICGGIFPNSYICNLHQRIVHSELSSSLSYGVSEIVRKRFSFVVNLSVIKCLVCKEKFSSSDKLLQHCIEHSHAPYSDATSDEQILLFCRNCRHGNFRSFVEAYKHLLTCAVKKGTSNAQKDKFMSLHVVYVNKSVDKRNIQKFHSKITKINVHLFQDRLYNEAEGVLCLRKEVLKKTIQLLIKELY